MDKVSYFVVNNLHCPSCIFTVKSTLNDELNIPATNVNVSLVSQTITVRHNKSITLSVIAHALEKVGFDVEVEDNDIHPTHSSWNPLSGQKRKRRHREICKSCQVDHHAKQEKRTTISKPSFSKSFRSSKSLATERLTVAEGLNKSPPKVAEVCTELLVSGMTCASCANAITEGVKANRARGVLSCDVDVLSNSAKVVHDSSRISADDVASLIEELGYHAEVVSSKPMSRRQRVTSHDYTAEYRLEFHIGGMSCASCSNSITQGLQDEPYVKSVNINLMSNSGTVILSNKEDAQKVKEAVENMGFICDLGEIAPLRPLEGSTIDDVRLVRIRIDGMFCR
jgi:copper ion binding protein